MKKLKCMVVSDTHGKHNDIIFDKYRDCNVFIHCGDFSMTRMNQEKEIKNFLEWLDNLDFEYKIFIAGNHETFIEENKEIFNEILKDYPELIYLENESIIIEGIKFYGSPYSNQFFNWAFMEEEFELNGIWNQIDDNTQVLLTHGPAYMCKDLVKHPMGIDPHVGSQSLTYRKRELMKLSVHCFGHIHESYGAYIDYQNVLNLNASILDDDYYHTHEPLIFEIETLKDNKVKTTLIDV